MTAVTFCQGPKGIVNYTSHVLPVNILRRTRWLWEFLEESNLNNPEFISGIKKWDTFCLPQYTESVWDFMEYLQKVMLKLHSKKKERLEGQQKGSVKNCRILWSTDLCLMEWRRYLVQESLTSISPRTVLWPEGNTNQIRIGFWYWVGKYVCKLNWLEKILHGKSQVRRAGDLLYRCSHINIMMKTAQTVMWRESELFRVWILL